MATPTVTDLEHAIDIQRRGYRLLQWLEQAISRGFIGVDAAHDYTSFAATAGLWLERHYADIPADARPPRDQLPAFANYVASFAHASFDLVAHPGQRLYSPAAHCFCPFCSWLVDVPHLRPKRLTKQHKRDAERLLAAHLRERAFELDHLLDDEEIAWLLTTEPELREQLALCVYAQQLIARIEGQPTSPAVLALWRMFAWTPSGSPRPDFHLGADLILSAWERVRLRLHDTQ